MEDVRQEASMPFLEIVAISAIIGVIFFVVASIYTPVLEVSVDFSELHKFLSAVR